MIATFIENLVAVFILLFMGYLGLYFGILFIRRGVEFMRDKDHTPGDGFITCILAPVGILLAFMGLQILYHTIRVFLL